MRNAYLSLTLYRDAQLGACIRDVELGLVLHGNIELLNSLNGLMSLKYVN